MSRAGIPHRMIAFESTPACTLLASKLAPMVFVFHTISYICDSMSKR